MKGHRIVWAVMLPFAVGLYLFANGTASRLLLVSVILLPPLSALLALLPVKTPELLLDIPSNWQRGMEVSCTLLLKNRGGPSFAALAATLHIHNLLTGEETITPVFAWAGGKQSVAIHCCVTVEHTGRLEISLENPQLVEPCGIFTRRLGVHIQETCTVPPVPFPVVVTLAESALMMTDCTRYSTARAGSDPSEIFQIREYIPGDPIRQIHWKLSEKTDRLMVREFGLPVVNQVLLLLETSLPPNAILTPEELDAILDTLVSVSAALTEMGTIHSIGWLDEESVYQEQEIRSEEDMTSLLVPILSHPFRASDFSATDGCRGAHAHIAVISSYVEPGIESLCMGNRVTLLLLERDAARSGLWAGGVGIVPFQMDTAPQELSEIEL